MRGHPNIDRAAAFAQLGDAVRALSVSYRAVFEPADGWPRPSDEDDVINAYWSGLQGAAGEDAARALALEIVTHLVPHQAREAAFWRTPLGQACAWWIGYTAEAVPQQVAANIFGITRQVITKLIQRGRLATRAVEGLPAHIDRDALIDRLHRLNG